MRGAAQVTVGGHPVLRAGHGTMRLETPSQIASISKHLSHLACAGDLDLHEPVTRWLRGTDPSWADVTLHHLLSHTAGVRHWDATRPGFEPANPLDIEQRIALITAAPLLHPPGGQWLYSSPGFLVVGQVVSTVTGTSCAELVRDLLLAPLALTSTSLGAPPPATPSARGHRDSVEIETWDLSAMPGTGDVWSTVGDLSQLVRALHSGELIGANAIRLMTTPHVSLEASPDRTDEVVTSSAYGYGTFLGTVGGHRAHFHPGDNPGYQSLLVWLPDRDASIAVLLNDEADDLEAILSPLRPYVGSN